ncbi:MAG: RnfH family protein [Gammaproteobacteria bacterium]|nr:RnfH family protein [Gammaproteobacteria bacterium]
MNVGIAYDNGKKQVWLKLEVPDGSTVRDVIDLSKLLEKFPEIDLQSQKVGIFGRATKLDAVVTDGNRVEVYRPIIADPETVERRDR